MTEIVPRSHDPQTKEEGRSGARNGLERESSWGHERTNASQAKRLWVLGSFAHSYSSESLDLIPLKGQ